MKISRRQALKSSLALATAINVPTILSASNKKKSNEFVADPKLDRIPKKGEEFNEMIMFSDEVSARTIRRLTSKRRINNKSTYHIRSCFKEHYMTFATHNDPKDGSALIRADVITGDLKVLDHTETGADYHFGSGGNMVPNSPYVCYNMGDNIILYDIFTSEKIVYPLESGTKAKHIEGHYWGGPAGTCDGKYLLIPFNDKRLNWDDTPEVRAKSVGTSLFKMEVVTGKMEEVFRDETCKNNHVIANPIDPDYCLIDRDLPPHFYGRGDNGKTARVWVLHIPTGKLTAITPNDKCKFAYHSNWNYDGTHVYYHGPSDAPSLREQMADQGVADFVSPYGECNPKFSSECNPHFVGVADMKGNIVWEGLFPSMYYGHTGSHSTKDIVFVDSLVTDRYVLGFHWRELNKRGMPRTDMVLAHNSIYVDSMQASHPHCIMSDDGKWMAYNAQRNGKTDIFVADMDE